LKSSRETTREGDIWRQHCNYSTDFQLLTRSTSRTGTYTHSSTESSHTTQSLTQVLRLSDTLSSYPMPAYSDQVSSNHTDLVKVAQCMPMTMTRGRQVQMALGFAMLHRFLDKPPPTVCFVIHAHTNTQTHTKGKPHRHAYTHKARDFSSAKVLTLASLPFSTPHAHFLPLTLTFLPLTLLFHRHTFTHT
jgi:hypothetical protein